jgi:hypothetical protein
MLTFSDLAQGQQAGWKQVPLGGSITTRLYQGSKRELQPSCSGGAVLREDGTVRQAITDYSFFIQKGDRDKILIAIDGGGACWDAASCLLSPLNPDLFGGQATYSPEVNETAGMIASMGGILDSDNPANPFQNYTKVFVPYCTGDIHWGSRDTEYEMMTEQGLLKGTIRHRGADNLLAVLDWLKNHGISFKKASDVSVAGVSAGGYGANLAFAYVAALTNRKARLNLISDSAMGVIDTPYAAQLPFFTTALHNPADPGSESWGVAQNFPSWVFGPPESFLAAGANRPLGFVPAMFSAFANYKPQAKLASITTNLDLVQIGFYGLMKGVSPGQTEAGEWYKAMSSITSETSAAPNYRYFIEDGVCHTSIFTDPEFYRSGINGVSVADWISAMTKRGNSHWDSTPVWPPSGSSKPEACSPLG